MKKTHPKIAIIVFASVAIVTSVFILYKGQQSMYISNRDLFTSVITPENITNLTNDSRRSANLDVLNFSDKLALAAQNKAEDMISKEYFSHTSPDGRLPWDFMESAGYDYIYAGENLAIRFTSAESVLDGWLTSPEHKENIEDSSYTEIGVGVAQGLFHGVDTIVVVQMFGRPVISDDFRPSAPESAADAQPIRLSPLMELKRLVESYLVQ